MASIKKIATQLFINGKYVNSHSGKQFQVLNPSTEAIITHVERGSNQDIDLAVKSARHAFDHGPWTRMDPSARGDCLFRLADLVKKHNRELAQLQSLDNGKPFHIAQAVDIQMTYRVFKYYAGWADKIRGHTLPSDGPFFAYTKREPVGVVGQIIPWNFPLVMLSWKLGPALAAGCTVVMKIAEQTPLTALRMGQLINEAGIPHGVVNIVSGFGDIGAHLARHKDIDKIAFTGSSEVGYEIMRKSHDKNLKRVTLQLGGKSANIITKNASIDIALKQSIMALFFNAGQCCIAGSRTFVHSSVYDQFVSRAGKQIQGIKVGDPFDPNTDQGPLISQQQFDKVLSYIDIGVKQGAKLVVGGKRHGTKGYFVEPTLFGDVKDHMRIAKEQIFGPVMSVFKFETNEEVIRRANQSEYGLGAGVITENVEEMQWFVDRLKSGTVYGNCYNVLQQTLPFGGYKDSGVGRELGEEGLNNYLESKTVIIKK